MGHIIPLQSIPLFQSKGMDMTDKIQVQNSGYGLEVSGSHWSVNPSALSLSDPLYWVLGDCLPPFAFLFECFVVVTETIGNSTVE